MVVTAEALRMATNAFILDSFAKRSTAAIIAQTYTHESGRVHMSPPHAAPTVSQFAVMPRSTPRSDQARKKSISAVSMPFIEKATDFASTR